MFHKNPDNIKYLYRWEKKFGFEGDLNIVKLPNPRVGEQGAGTTMYVYRPWTAEDVRKATEGIPHPKVNARGFSDACVLAPKGAL